MNVVIPMAGRGSRFAALGVATPKPLIDIRGRPMYAWAMDSLPLGLARRVIFIALREHLDRYDLAADIRDRYQHCNVEVLGLDDVTEGQACTVLEAREFIDTEEPVLIYNADTYCRTSLADRLPRLNAEADGVIGVFQASGTKWSFVRLDDTGRVVETAEKRRISDWATTGLYHFSRGRDFVRHAEAMITAGDRVRGEYYVAPVYNRMLSEGADIRIDRALEVWVLGTPEDLATFEQGYPR